MPLPETCHACRNFPRLFVLLACILLGGAMARAEGVVLAPGVQSAEVTPALRYWASLETEVSEALAQWEAGAFGIERVTTSYGPGYSPETWAGVTITNAAPLDGRPPDSFILTFDAPVVSGVRLFLIREDGLTENLMDYSIFAPFDPLDHAVTRLRAPAFALAPGETVTLLAHVQTGPFPTFGMELHSPEHLAQASFLWGIGLTAFYAFAIACLVFFFGFQVAMGSWTGAMNSAMFAAFLGLVAVMDGLFWRFFYPQHPEWQSTVGFGMLFAISGAGFLIAGAGIGAKAPRAGRVVLALALVSLAGFAISLVSPGQGTAFLAYGLIALMLGCNIFSARAAQGTGLTPPVGAVLLARLATAGAVGAIVLIVTGLGEAWLDAPLAIRAVFFFMLLATMTTLTANVIALRRRHLSAVEARVEALEAEAERSRELLEAERNYTRARDLAALRQRQLATASHDLRQPLMSLRMTFDTLAAEMKPDVKARLNEAFDYLASLATGYVDESVPEGGEEEGVLEPVGEAEAYPLSVPLGTVRQMFEGEAASKGVLLRVAESSAEVTVPPLALMRIVTNLVSNAIKYTTEGRVVVGVRRGGGLRLVVADTGQGMSAAEVAQFSEAYAKGAASTGHGLGLSVCFELARANGLRLEVRSEPGRGTCFTLWLEG
ncbi:hypothetical protein FHY55_16120 [Oceanicola sp. D3]|uniref:ATP-binding protein n=1 Tax=Oceanicola sp. D3 TaxID=2587163 RepID=UPI0011245457|nr:ATP-binding protein [Oceanicola sp. D3]QDC10664.1 hypothetical protein FHY55_16120 [Oceanicola sp. D3]